MNYQLLTGDVLDMLQTLPNGSVHCVVTSPPYFGLRDYGQAGQIGLEDTPDAYVAKLVEVFREVRRVLRDDGTVWLNLGDSYAGSGKGRLFDGTHAETSKKQMSNQGTMLGRIEKSYTGDTIKPKDLVGIPWMVAFALRADGWFLRSEIVWAKGNPMPESVRDRPTKSHEYIFLLSKARRYFYDADAIREPQQQDSLDRLKRGWHGNGERGFPNGPQNHLQNYFGKSDAEVAAVPGRNKRTVWHVNTRGFPGAHFAVFPEKLIEPCILAGTSAYGCCAQCGAPWQRVIEKPDMSQRPVRADDAKMNNGQVHVSNGWEGYPKSAGQAYQEWRNANPDVTTGWRPSCTCNRAGIELAPDDLELIETPLGQRVADDPSLLTGRAGMNRPRGDHEGSRPITRYEQRQYAEQLRASPQRPQMAMQAGEAFAHYLRTDRSGARPVPDELLEAWITAGWLQRVTVPTLTPVGVLPCVVLDPFSGSATTGVVALKQGRAYIGIDLNPAYQELAHARIRGAQPLLRLAAD